MTLAAKVFVASSREWQHLQVDHRTTNWGGGGAKTGGFCADPSISCSVMEFLKIFGINYKGLFTIQQMHLQFYRLGFIFFA